MKRYAGVLLFLLLLLVGHDTKFGTPAPEEPREAIRNYNGLLADGYRRLNMNHLVHAATGDRARKAYYHMAALGEGGVKMDSTLRSLEFIATKQLAPDQAEITCQEQWGYAYINLDNGHTSPRLTVNYTARYRMVKERGKWLVADITILNTDRTSDADELSIFKRPDDRPQGSAVEGDGDPLVHPQKAPPRGERVSKG